MSRHASLPASRTSTAPSRSTVKFSVFDDATTEFADT